MINTGGNDFRTLAQPIFVNGQRVKEVWVDGHMVYPFDVSDFNILKPLYHIVITRATKNYWVDNQEWNAA